MKNLKFGGVFIKRNIYTLCEKEILNLNSKGNTKSKGVSGLKQFGGNLVSWNVLWYVFNPK